jgi:hypothetical protein
VSSPKRSQTADIWRKRSFAIKAAARCFQGNGYLLAQTIDTRKNVHRSNSFIFLRCWSKSTSDIRYELYSSLKISPGPTRGRGDPDVRPKWNRLAASKLAKIARCIAVQSAKESVHLTDGAMPTEPWSKEYAVKGYPLLTLDLPEADQGDPAPVRAASSRGILNSTNSGCLFGGGDANKNVGQNKRIVCLITAEPEVPRLPPQTHRV